MKISIGLMLCALGASVGVAGAQTQTKETVPELKKGLAPPFMEQELGALPKLDPNSRARTEIRVLPTSRGEVFQVEAVRQSIGDILRTITAVMGVRAVVDPKLDELRLSTVAFRASSWEELLDSISVAERWKSASGTYFFAAQPGVVGVITLGEMDQEAEKYRREEAKRRADPRYDPFVLPRGGLDPKDRFGRPIEPQHEWQKREFNGHEYYFIPGPLPVPSDDASPKPDVVPSPNQIRPQKRGLFRFPTPSQPK